MPWEADELKGHSEWTPTDWTSDGTVFVQEEMTKTSRRLRCRSMDDGRTLAVVDLPTVDGVLVFPSAVAGKGTERNLNGLVVYGNAVWYIETHWTRSTGNYRMYAHGFTLPTLAPMPATAPIVDLDLRQTGFAGRFLLGIDGFTVNGGYKGEIVESPDGSKLAYYWDDLKADDGTRMAVVKVFNDRFEPLADHRGHHLQFEHKGLLASKVAVGDDGVVYALMQKWSKDKEVTKHELHYDFMVLRFGDQIQHQPIVLGNGAAVLDATLLALPQGPLVAGFYVQPEVTTDQTVGTFTAEPGKDLAGTATADLFPFGAPVEHGVQVTRTVHRPDGGIYLVGNARTQSNTSVQFHAMCAMSVAADGAHQWQTVVPRYYVTQYGYGPNLRCAITEKNNLLVIFEDSPANNGLRKSGGEVRRISLGDGVPVVAHFDGEGNAAYGELAQPGNPRTGMFGPLNNSLIRPQPNVFTGLENGAKKGETLVRRMKY